MTTERPVGSEQERRALAEDNGGSSAPQVDPDLETLREILFKHQAQRIAQLEAELAELQRRITDKDAFVAMITPVLGDAIRRKIRDARDEMIEALYPIIGQTVVRAVSEAMRDLVRTIDGQMRSTFDVRSVGRRLRARASGVSSAEMVLRESLPFDVAELFLIHRESGLLLWHISRDPDASPDSDLIGGMLTAIRDFVKESFGRNEAGELNEIQYGERRILIEAAQHAYLAIVVDGIEPPGFRAEMRERIIEVDHSHEITLRQYDGNPAPLAPVEAPLRSLVDGARPKQLSPTQKRILAGMAAAAAICVAASCVGGLWGWQWLNRPLPPAVAIVVTATPLPSTPTLTPSATPTATPPPTATPTSTPTSTPPPTATATASPTLTPTLLRPVAGVMTSNVWLYEKPSTASVRLGVIVERGQAVEILAMNGNWYHVRWSSPDAADVVGWAPVEWVDTANDIPAPIITPTP